MKPKDHPPRRKAPVHQPIHRSDSSNIVLFLTVNTRSNQPILARHDVHDLLRETWVLADDWRVGRYMIMPEHLHFLCSPRDCDAPFRRWMRFWRSQASMRWPRSEENPVWQREYWDTQLRPGESYEQKSEYMRMNPVRRGLVERPEDWPFAGEIENLEWWG